MAYIETKERKDGEATHVDRWRAGGARTGKRESEVFDDHKAAERFRDLVKGHGERRVGYAAAGSSRTSGVRTGCSSLSP
ncbi:hypothetical protein ACFQVC_17035 [Streptomyces monticola]|uniref:WGR domain-containing protein n=1 Tax=Streptomyces monticola TaxID=2666263 RepID=A0ABW2JK96_9ACTN